MCFLNDTECTAFGQTALTDCGLENIEKLFTSIVDQPSLTLLSEPKLSDAEVCLATKTGNELFTNYTTCLNDCLEAEPAPTSYVTLLRFNFY